MELKEVFLRAGKKEEGVLPTSFLEAIFAERPDLRNKMTYFPQQGYNSHTVFIGDEVFKGPKRADQISAIEAECAVLLQMQSDYAPVVTCVGKDTVFFGMRRVSGAVLPNDFCTTFTDDDLRTLADDIADFVIDIQESFPGCDGKVMGHNDFNPGNVMIDPDSRRLVAVIDYGYAGYVSPEHGHQFQGIFEGVKQAYASFNIMLDEAYSKRTGVSAAKAPTPPAVKSLNNGL